MFKQICARLNHNFKSAEGGYLKTCCMISEMKFVQDKILLLLEKNCLSFELWGVLFGIGENITNQINGSGVKLMEENLQKMQVDLENITNQVSGIGVNFFKL